MQYLLTLYLNQAGWPRLSKAEQERGMAASMAYTEAFENAGILKGNGRLQPSSTAATVRIADGKPQVLDGPFADSKEQLGGYYLIEVPAPDAAISWATRCPRQVTVSSRCAHSGLRALEQRWGRWAGNAAERLR